MNAMTRAERHRIEHAQWLEQQLSWLTVALYRAQKCRDRARRAPPFSLETKLAADDHASAMARAKQLRDEIRGAGFTLDPLLEEAFVREFRT